ncbi:hypothetical protein JG790_22065 [Citrobacter freundii]|nr:hypothetical protein [Citrobacter freundii]MBJ7588290.1 hypothetical protein [Citrobacter freundii]
MKALNKQARQVQRYINYGVDMMEWADGGYVRHSDYLALLKELEAAEKRIAELDASHSKQREGMAAIYNAICENGASTSLSAILTFVKRSREESASAAGIGMKGE